MKMQAMTKQDVATSSVGTNGVADLGALFDGHIAREFADFDVDATMETMVAEPYVSAEGLVIRYPYVWKSGRLRCPNLLAEPRRHFSKNLATRSNAGRLR